MLKLSKLLCILNCLVLFSGCATPYQKQTWYSYTGGYSDLKLSNNSFAITFNGNALIDNDTSIDYALLRSAEISWLNGFKYFKIVENNYDTINNEMYDNVKNIFGKPSVINIIYCYNERPINDNGIFYDVSKIIKQIRKKYNIKK